ncbi:hypothetical protein Tco_1279616 [Tanacetum coccineum]
MDDEPMWATDRVVALTPGFAITIPKTENEFAIKGYHLTLVEENQLDRRIKIDPHKHVPQPSDPTESVGDEAVHKELGDSLVRASTTASSLEAEQDNGSINKTRSKETPNESSSQRTNSSSGLRRVKKLEKKNRSRTHKLKGLYKVGLTARVESSGDEESLEVDEEVVKVINTAKLIIDVSQCCAGEEVFATTVDDITLAQALEEMKSTKPKKKRVVIQELEPVKPMKKKDLIRLDEETALNLQAKFNEEERLAREKTKKKKKPILP